MFVTDVKLKFNIQYRSSLLRLIYILMIKIGATYSVFRVLVSIPGKWKTHKFLQHCLLLIFSRCCSGTLDLFRGRGKIHFCMIVIIRFTFKKTGVTWYLCLCHLWIHFKYTLYVTSMPSKCYLNCINMQDNCKFHRRNCQSVDKQYFGNMTNCKSWKRWL